MSAKTLEIIAAKRLAVAKQLELFEASPDIGTFADLPLPSTPADVADVDKKFNEESKDFVSKGLEKLSAGAISESLPWDSALYVLFCAWIVNFGHDATKPHEDAPLPESLAAKAIIDQKQCQANILAAAAHLKLDWVMLVDLALVSYKESLFPISGPFAGVFIGRGSSPFMVLSFKGTTYQKELNTDADALAVAPRDGILYGQRVHNGMQKGLFNKFEVLDEDAFEIIWQDLELIAADLKAENGGKNVPLYVTGHSLGAGYATLAYVELIRRLDLLGDTSPRSYDLKDLWSFASPRVGRDAFAAKVQSLMNDTPNRHIYRPTRFHDIVPTVPPLLDVPDNAGYKHVGEGWKLSPDEENYLVARKNEVGTTIENDPKPNSMDFHWPWMYYEGIVKVLDPVK